MTETFLNLKDILSRSKQALADFMQMLEPVIENAKDEHERLYFHHIYEEEEHRSDRLQDLFPKIDALIENPAVQNTRNPEFIHVLQDLSLEKFGLHNFLEHLDLALYQFKDTEHAHRLQEMREMTFEDYQETKKLMQVLNEQFDGAASKGGSVPMDDKEDVREELKIDMYTDGADDRVATETQSLIKKKSLTVGSLKNLRR
ncbi:encapsulated protein [Lihuaxuella thermophila]|uniref:Encapsulated protein n=1 Tax=Lihuaxuella thermophila TaxID=1173111 RepID=A0A1H8IY95_9BACL|nr:encapsulated protein [Lihuaxuella thermophila]